MYDMIGIDRPERVREWCTATLSRKEKIMGFGHRVNKNGHSLRVHDVRRVRGHLAPWWRYPVARRLSRIRRRDVEPHGSKPNPDFPAGPASRLTGFDIA
ncbi:hypothetical protein EF294_04710 [Gordonia oryzae]|uniref:citrate synthase (unknown stereospecificity) n=1 Tax=Gordonia oryzae TaxID=2487349 RepID=A0A3N4GWA8_9ACTN|nr:hypothetical protein EF294_04710 [Gordonia oryzae]